MSEPCEKLGEDDAMYERDGAVSQGRRGEVGMGLRVTKGRWQWMWVGNRTRGGMSLCGWMSSGWIFGEGEGMTVDDVRKEVSGGRSRC